MQITVVSFNDQLVTVQVDGEMTIETLKAILEAETQIPAAQQALLWNNGVLQPDSLTMAAAGVKDGDVIQMAPNAGGAGRGGGAGAARAAAPRGGAAQQPQQDRRLAQNPDGSAVSPAAFAAAMRENQAVLAQLQMDMPDLYKAVVDDDLVRLQDRLRHYQQRRVEAAQAERSAAAEEEELYRRVAADPFDLEAQRRIEELIQQKNIEENFMHAMEHSPEVFASVTMLYVDMEVNGVHVKAFIDSGAQMTIMTSTFVEQCHLARLVDKRFKGMAMGVGSSVILGRVHQAPLKVSGHFITCSISVLEQKSGPQFIFGLDMLRRHQCSIDLKRGVLALGSINAEVPFLPESEVPRDITEQIEQRSEEEAAKSMATAKRSVGETGLAGGGGGGTSAGASGSSQQPASAAPPAAPAAAGAAAGAPPGGGAGGGQPASDEAVANLVALGFSAQEAEGALRLTKGDVEAAAAYLTFGGN